MENQQAFEALKHEYDEEERTYAERQLQMMEDHQNELDRRNKDQAEKVEADQQRFQDLLDEKTRQDSSYH